MISLVIGKISIFHKIKFISDHSLILEKEMAIHSSILAWKIPWIEEPGTVHEVAGVGHDLERKQTLRIEP